MKGFGKRECGWSVGAVGGNLLVSGGLQVSSDKLRSSYLVINK